MNTYQKTRNISSKFQSISQAPNTMLVLPHSLPEPSEFREDCHCSFKKGVLTIHLERVNDSGMLFLNHRGNPVLLPCDVSSRGTSSPLVGTWDTPKAQQTGSSYSCCLSFLHASTKHEDTFLNPNPNSFSFKIIVTSFFLLSSSLNSQK